jgi:ferritin-like metal-binding protein YciE
MCSLSLTRETGVTRRRRRARRTHACCEIDESFMKPLNKVFWDEMAEMLHVKEMLLKALHRMNTAVTRPGLKEMLEAYKTDVQEQNGKLREMFENCEMFPREKKCDGMMGMLLKGQQIVQRTGEGPVLDAALLSLCRKITAYNLVSLNALLSWAKLIMPTENETLKTLKELVRIEMDADLRFSRLSGECDLQASKQDGDSPRRAPAAPRKPTRELAGSARSSAW